MQNTIDKIVYAASLIGIPLVVIGGTIAKIGFTKSGIAAKSIASYIQSGFGNVAKKSFFAYLQSLGAKAIFYKILIASGIIVILVCGAIVAYSYWK